MKITVRKNEYKHEVLDCPFCDGWVYLRATTKSNPDSLRDLKRHITHAAKNEASMFSLGETDPTSENQTPHLDYYKEHTSVRPVVPKVAAKRQFDNDMTV